jgi:hypothetical protein
MPHFDRLGNDIDISLADEGYEPPTLPEEDPYFSPEEEARQDELGAEYGDPRRCPKHPEVQTSSADGMFDAPCGKCEYEGEKASYEWDHNPENAYRPFCAELGAYIPKENRWPIRCMKDEEEIPF